MNRKTRIIFRADGNSRIGLGQVPSHLKHTTNVQLREAKADDLQLLYVWVNDLEVRRCSFNPEPISIEDHTRWFQSKLHDLNSINYIAEINGEPAAQIRFDIAGGKATISYLIAREFRGQGLGKTVLQKGVEKLLEQKPEVNQIEGLVQQNNKASIRTFEKVGFNYGEVDSRYPNAYRFMLVL